MKSSDLFNRHSFSGMVIPDWSFLYQEFNIIFLTRMKDFLSLRVKPLEDLRKSLLQFESLGIQG